LLDGGHDDISRLHEVPVLVLAAVVLDPVALVAASLVDRVEVVQRRPVVREPAARVAEPAYDVEVPPSAS
jgi:hypothetical protein